jgi:hypothetical protein
MNQEHEGHTHHTQEEIDNLANQLEETNYKRNATLSYIALQQSLVSIHNQHGDSDIGKQIKVQLFNTYLDDIEEILPRSLVFKTENSEDGSLVRIDVYLNSTPSRYLCSLKLGGKALEIERLSVGEKEQSSNHSSPPPSQSNS